jgi:hypothetical protein
LAERPVVLFNELTERLRHFVGSRQHDRARVRVELTTQAKLEALEAVGDERLQTGQFFDILIDAVILQLSQRVDDFIELARIDLFPAQQPPQVLCLAGVLTGLVAKLTDVLRRQADVATFPPSTPRRSASPCAAAIVAACRVAAAAIARITTALAAAIPCWPSPC